jgi:hypothetical protein
VNNSGRVKPQTPAHSSCVEKEIKSIRIRTCDTRSDVKKYIHNIRSYQPILLKDIDIILRLSDNEKIQVIMELNKVVQHLLSLMILEPDMLRETSK